MMKITSLLRPCLPIWTIWSFLLWSKIHHDDVDVSQNSFLQEWILLSQSTWKLSCSCYFYTSLSVQVMSIHLRYRRVSAPKTLRSLILPLIWIFVGHHHLLQKCWMPHLLRRSQDHLAKKAWQKESWEHPTTYAS
jgi:hypothetical protein